MAKNSVNIDAQCAKILSDVREGRFRPLYLLMGDEPYYPVNDEKNQALYEKYTLRAASERVIFGGRLGEYKYYDMDKTVERALALARSLMV